MSDQTPALAAALAKVQANLPKLERDRTVEVKQKSGDTYSYSYATLANLSEAVLPLLAANGLSFIAMPGIGNDGKMAVRYSLMHESGEALTGEFPLSAEGGIQALGGRITYVRRYCLAAVVGIAADEDNESRLGDDSAPRTAQRRPRQQAETDGNGTAQRARPAARPPLPGEQEQPPEMVTAPQLTKIQATLTSIGWTDRADKLRAASTIVGRPLGSAKDLTKHEAHELIKALEMVISDSDDPATQLTELLDELQAREGGA